MKGIIKQLCQKIEKENGVKILFAVENGSRAWRMESKDSDYDVRFVFVRSLNDYIQINKPSDVIEAAFDKKGKPHPIKGSFIDFSGFDIFKFAKMLSSSNPTVIEWLVTDIVYYGKQNLVFKKFAINNFNSISLYHHYKSMCRNNYLKYLKSGDQVTYKRYLYAMRGLINAKWIVYEKTVPPIRFAETLRHSKKLIPKSIIGKLNEIIKLKSKGKEKEITQNIVSMDKYIEDFLKDNNEEPKTKSHSTFNELNEELRRIVLDNKT